MDKDKINDKIYPSEIHYVFVELGKKKCFDSNHKCSNICGGVASEDGNIFVIGRVIDFSPYYLNKNVFKTQVELTNEYYEYDGTLTFGTFDPVRWVVGDEPVLYNLEELLNHSKTARPLQPLNGRIILFSSC